MDSDLWKKATRVFSRYAREDWEGELDGSELGTALDDLGDYLVDTAAECAKARRKTDVVDDVVTPNEFTAAMCEVLTIKAHVDNYLTWLRVHDNRLDDIEGLLTFMVNVMENNHGLNVYGAANVQRERILERVAKEEQERELMRKEDAA